MSEYDHEPVRGLPGELPESEHIIWQGAPDWKQLAGSALHIRLAGVYFGALAIMAVMQGSFGYAAVMTGLGAVVIGLFSFFAWGVGRTTVYTLTNRRIVLRIGVALNKCINLPLTEIESANLKKLPSGHGNVVLALKGMPRLGYWMLWPHARSLRIIRPQPMLRAIPEATQVAEKLFHATEKLQDIAPATPAAETAADIPLEGVPA